jgi:hypothetical protein
MEVLSLLAAIAIGAPSPIGTPPCTPQKNDPTSSLITFGGGVLAASIGIIGQYIIVRRQINAQSNNITSQIEAQSQNIKSEIEAQSKNISDQAILQSIARLRGRKEDLIVDKVVLLLDSSDPELKRRPDYPSIVSAVHSIQLFLDLTSPWDRALNQAINSLAHTARSLLSPSDEEAFVSHLADLQANGLETEAMEAQMEREEDISRQLLTCQAEVINATQKLIATIPVQQSKSFCDNSREAA